MAENTAAGQSVGAPVRATDGNNDILTYTLSGSDDDDLFDINWGTGQIMTKSELNLEERSYRPDNSTVGTNWGHGSGYGSVWGPRGSPVDDTNSAEVMVTDHGHRRERTAGVHRGAETHTIAENAE